MVDDLRRAPHREGRSFLKQDKARIVFVVILLVAISALFVAMTRKFLMTILLAAIFSGLAQPLYRAHVPADSGPQGTRHRFSR